MASVLLGLQLSALFEDYNSYPTKTSIKVSYGSLIFPSVTLCNMNLVKSSKLDKFPNISKALKETTTETKPVKSEQQSVQQEETGQEPEGTPDQSAKTERKNDWNFWMKDIRVSLRKTKQSLRLDYGLRKSDFIIQAEFNEIGIPKDDIHPVLSSEYGTCYLISVNDSDTAGLKYGMKLTLFLDKDEYIEELSDGYGIRLVIHEKGTFPLPSEEGHVLNPGYQTDIGIGLRTIERLGHPYGKCIDGREFLNDFGYHYSIPVCYALCHRERTFKTCNCIPYTSPEVLGEDSEAEICSMENECAKKTKKEIKIDPGSCNCFSKCEESVYSTRFSSRRWPNPTHLRNNIYGAACEKNITNINKVCQEIQQRKLNINYTNYKDYAEYFVKVYIYFETLVFEEMSEEPLYSTIGLLSDIGGSMGFFLGASFLTYLELVHLLVELLICLFKYLCRSHTFTFSKRAVVKPRLEGEQ